MFWWLILFPAELPLPIELNLSLAMMSLRLSQMIVFLRPLWPLSGRRIIRRFFTISLMRKRYNRLSLPSVMRLTLLSVAQSLVFTFLTNSVSNGICYLMYLNSVRRGVINI
ncbi:hypothetical protein D3C73_797540 [compost metagenome]